MVTEIEERDAARFCSYSWTEWLELDYYDKVDGIAHMRLDNLIKLVQNEVENQVMDRMSRSRGA